MMRRRWPLACALATAVLLAGAPAGGTELGRETPASGAAAPRDRWTIGVRLAHVALEESRRYLDGRLDNDNRSGNFLGSLWGLEPQPSWRPAPSVECRVVSSAGLGAAYDEIRIRTLDWADNEAQTTTAGDGDLRLRGARVYAFVAAPSHLRLTPLFRVGFARYASAFFETGGWARPGWRFVTEDTQGWFIDLTLRAKLLGHLQAEASYEYLQLREVAATALSPRGSTIGAFPARADVARVGLVYGF